MTTKHKRLDPIHPGEIFLEDSMTPMGVCINRLARDVVVPPCRTSDAHGCTNAAGGMTPRATAIVNGKHAITVDTGLRLGITLAPLHRHGWACRLIATCRSHSA